MPPERFEYGFQRIRELEDLPSFETIRQNAEAVLEALGDSADEVPAGGPDAVLDFLISKKKALKETEGGYDFELWEAAIRAIDRIQMYFVGKRDKKLPEREG